MYKQIVQVGIVMLIFCMPVVAQNVNAFTVHNSSAKNFERTIAISFDSLSSPVSGANCKLLDAGKRPQLCQWLPLERKMLVWVQIPARSSKKYFIEAGLSSSHSSKLYGRAVPERYDDFAWENDRIAYRMYGAALQQTAENAFGIDVWAKRTKNLVIDRWYKSGDYHTDKGEGLDFYKVGFTLGAGDVAPYVNDSICFSGNYVRSRIINSGPLRFCFELDYNPWKAGDVTVTATKRITLDAGAQLNTMELTYQLQGATQLPVAMGIVRRKEGGEIWMDQNKSIIAYWEPAVDSNGQMGVAIVCAKPTKMLATEQHLLALDTIHHNKVFSYRFGAVWSKAGAIASADEWRAYLQQKDSVNISYHKTKKATAKAKPKI